MPLDPEPGIFDDNDYLWYCTDFRNCEFKNCDFKNLTWKKVYFRDTTFQNCNIRNLQFINSDLIKSRLINTNWNTVFFRIGALDFLEIKKTRFTNLNFDLNYYLGISKSDQSISMSVQTSEDFNTAIEIIQNEK